MFWVWGVRLVLVVVFAIAIIPAAALALVVEAYLRAMRWLAGGGR